MKKIFNAFKQARFTTATRAMIAFCVIVVLVAGGLFLSIPENRGFMRGWFGPDISRKDSPSNTDSEEAGLQGTATVNGSLQVRSLDPADHLWGPIAAPVQLIVYDDFECPFCAQLYDSIQKAKTEFGSDIVVAVRHFPLSSHEQAVPAAIASECASDQGKFWEMYHELFADSKAGRLSSEEIRTNGGTIGLDESAYSDCLTKGQYTDKILAQKAEIKELGVIGTPASFINNQYLPGAVPYEDFTHPDGTAALGLRSLIKQKLGEARK